MFDTYGMKEGLKVFRDGARDDKIRVDSHIRSVDVEC